MKKILYTVLIIFTLIIFTGCKYGSGVAIAKLENNSSRKMSASYSLFTGFRQASVNVKENEIVEIKVNIVTESGKINLYITNEDEELIYPYEGHSLSTRSFTVTLKFPGKYIIKVETDHHKGSYSITW
ncbi:MAG TPA: hypothetical protein PLS66_10130 [Tepiditoga sp.]|nr:hypothetical protein [Thermotogota bacterium]HOO75643.1 hypothetical protein [Tepiditoga sp.]